jgi:hypothetical protein
LPAAAELSASGMPVTEVVEREHRLLVENAGDRAAAVDDR